MSGTPGTDKSHFGTNAPGGCPHEVFMKISTIFGKVLSGIVSVAISLAILFFAGIGVVALITKQDYVTVMNLAFDWIKNLASK